MTGEWSLWRAQIAAIMRLEIRKSFLNRRGFVVYLLAAMPVVIWVLHALVMRARGRQCNFGEDVHDLRLRRVGGSHTFGTAALAPGGRVELRVRLPHGRYVLWCSIADHRALGMQATLRVRR